MKEVVRETETTVDGLRPGRLQKKKSSKATRLSNSDKKKVIDFLAWVEGKARKKKERGILEGDEGS